MSIIIKPITQVVGMRRKRLIINKEGMKTVFSEKTGPLHRFEDFSHAQGHYFNTACGRCLEPEDGIVFQLADLGEYDYHRLCKACFRAMPVEVVAPVTVEEDLERR